ncbi:MAG: molybdenum cofactor guanylyltransferase [Caloramator sp.]|nr:molybdenum cofactor guanylyltransferase [Caloramator sp.]
MKLLGASAILCGGKSTRMGFDKCRIKVKNRLLLDIIIEKLSQAFEEVILVTNDKGRLYNYKNVFVDEYKGCGPAGGIYTALLNSKSKYLFVMGCDMPLINLEYITFMKGLLNENKYDCILTQKGNWVEPLYAFYSIDMIPLFKRSLEEGRYKLFDIIGRGKYLVIEEKVARHFSQDLEMFSNLNCVSDLEILKNRFEV